MATGWVSSEARQRPATALVATVAGVYFVVFAGWVLVGGVGARSVGIATSATFVLATATAAVFAALAARASAGRVKAAWTTMAAGLSSATLADVIWAGRDLLGWPVSFPSVADTAYLMFPVAVLVALLLFPSSRGRQSPSRLMLDGVIMGLSLLIVSWLTVMRQSYSARGQSWIPMLASLAYPVLNLLALTVATVVLVLSGLGARSTLTLLTLGLLCMTLAESIFAYHFVGDGPVSGHHLLEIGWTAGILLIVVAAAAGRTAVFEERQSEAPGWVSVLLPYAPLMLATVIVAVEPRSALTDRVILVAGIILILAVLARQFLAVAENKRLVAAVTDLAQHDPLTGLANRALFTEQLARTIQSRSGPDGEPVSVLFLDLDGFKSVNDTLGHGFGDEVLIAVARRLCAGVGPEHMVARLGGDEFAVLLKVSADEAHEIARRLSVDFESPFVIGGRQVRVGASVGLAAAGPDEVSAEELLKRADLTMYAAKRSRAAARYGASGPKDAASAQLLDELGDAVDKAHLTLVYQPKVDLLTRRVVGVEALLRWPHPAHGVLMPGRFLPFVRSPELMAAITDLVLRRALDDAQRWRRAGVDVPVSVNVFAPMMADLALPDRISTALAERDLTPGTLTVEVTEDLPLGRIGPTKIVFNELRRRGVRVSIDDFGAGYPALSYLCHLPVDEVKLDRNFIGPHSADARVEAVVRSVVALAGRLGLTVVAEGAADAQTIARLIEWDVRIAQGDHLGPPVDATAVPGLIHRLGPSPVAGLSVAP